MDVELAHELARDLNVALEFIPWTYDTLVEQLRSGSLDFVTGGLLVNTDRMTKMAFSEPDK